VLDTACYSYPVGETISLLYLYNEDYIASVLLYGCFYGLDYMVILWSELCVCMCLFVCCIYGPLFVVSPCNELSLLAEEAKQVFIGPYHFVSFGAVLDR
jgi:hypothetical protein